MKKKMDLMEWSTIFLRQKDMIKREIESLEEKDGYVVIHCKDGTTKIVIVKDVLTPASLKENPSAIICLNTKNNVLALHQDWEPFSKEEMLLLVFANPKTNEKWLLRPHLHHKIADKESLKSGLLSMHEVITKV